MDTFLAILKDEVEKIPESLRSSQYNIVISQKTKNH